MTLFRKFYLKDAPNGNRPGRASSVSRAARTGGRRKRAVRALFFTAVAVLGGSAFIEAQARRWESRIYSVQTAPSAPVAIVFGAAGSVLRDRVSTGVALYRAGKVRKLLMTGDNGRVGYNEPAEMREEAIRQGVPEKDIVCDYAGFRTYDSLYRARDIFGVSRALLVSQSYHLPRALYTGSRLGLTVDGVSADRRRYAYQKLYNGREVVSTVIAWIQVNLTHPRPKYLGPKEPIRVGEVLQLPPPFEGLYEGGLVGVVEVSADRHSVRDPGDLDAERLQDPREVHGRGIALHGRIHGKYDFMDGT